MEKKLDALVASMEELKTIVKQTNESVLEMKSEIAAMKQQMINDKAELKGDIENISQEFNDLKSRVREAERKNYFLEADNAQMYEAASMGRNLVVNGIPRKEDEMLYDIYTEIAQKIGLAKPPRARVSRFKGNQLAPSILIRFHSDIDKNDFKFNYLKTATNLTLRRLAGFNNSTADSRIFIQDQMSNATYQLHKAVIKLKHNRIFSQVLVENCAVFVKFTRDGEKIRVIDKDHLAAIVKKGAKI